jgi:hypothetical protein
MKGGMVTLEQSIHRVAYKVDFAKFAPEVFRWHHGFVDTATLGEERSK